MITSSDFQIDDTSYRTTTFQTTKGLNITEKLFKLMGESVAIIVSDMAGKGLSGEIQSESIEKAIKALCYNLGDGKTVQIIKDIISTTVIIEDDKTRPINFEIDFAGALPHMMKLVSKLIVVQILPFMDGFISLEKVAAAVGPKKTIKAK